LDGNLSSDGTWTYEWDAENRLRAMTMTNVAGIADANRLRLECAYDYQGRRVAKTVKTWGGSSFGNAVTQRFVYDGWNLLAILNSQSADLVSFVWGQDLSGTLDGAGGIGGLLWVSEIANGQIADSHFAAYDGNGNATALVAAGSGTPTARYEYSPFGETLRATGPMASANPFRFSTKYADGETGLIYYGYRYYNAAMGRWVSRDPIAEEGGIHLYAFVESDPCNSVDSLGEARWGKRNIRVSGFNVHSDWKEIEKEIERAKKAGMSAKHIEILEGIKKVAKRGGTTLFFLAAVQGAQAMMSLPEQMEEYAKFAASGDEAYKDLAAIDVAVTIQNATDNLFATYMVLGALLE